MDLENFKRHFSHQHYEGAASGPVSFLNPTTRRFSFFPKDHPEVGPGPPTNQQGDGDGGDSTKKNAPVAEDEEKASEVEQKWRSRDNRKGRHTITVTPATDGDAKYVTPQATNTFASTMKTIGLMFTTCPYWDVSYLVATIFTLGSLVWCINAFLVWLPLQDPWTEFPNEVAVGGGVTAFLGATIFEIGSVLLMIEAVNENRSDCFGWAVEEALEENGLIRVRPDKDGCSHHHSNRKNFLGRGKASQDKPDHLVEMKSKSDPNSADARTWTWFPSWHELTTHYFREIGFLACLSQMIGATIFWISGFTALPGIYDQLSPAAINGAFWAVQVIGGTGFIVSSILFMLETQEKWYLPAPTVLGWHVGLWNLIGALGFTLCGALGYSSDEAVIFESSLATFWGSWAFLIGSTIQWFESLDKHPVELEK